MRAYAFTKRSLDIFVSVICLVLLSPLMLAIAALVAVNLGRPILFRQQRPGVGSRPFALVKFRSMKVLDPDAGLVADVDRLTRFGRALRSTSLDEMPTLWNVLVGHMSLVGPRPLMMQYLDRYTPEQARRHEVRPGITGLVQANGRNALSWPQKLELDIVYVDGRGLLLDAKIVIATVGAVVARRGISASGEATMPEFTGTEAA